MLTFENWTNLNDEDDNEKKDFIEDMRTFKSDLNQFMDYWEKKLKETNPNDTLYHGYVHYKYPKPHTTYDVSLPYQDFLNSPFKKAEMRNKERIEKYDGVKENNNTNFPITNNEIMSKILDLSYQLEQIMNSMYNKTINKDDYKKLKDMERELAKIINNMTYYNLTNKKTGWSQF